MGNPKRPALKNTGYKDRINVLDEIELFKDEEDKKIFIEFMNEYSIIESIKIYGYSFENNDVIISFFDEKGKASKFMQCLKSRYCKSYNKKYERKGTIFKARFKSEIISIEELELIAGKFKNGSETINDGTLENSSLDAETVLNELAKYFDVSGDELFNMIENDSEIASIAAFSLRCFSDFLLKNVGKVLVGISETMASTLSLIGVKLIKGHKYSSIYYKLLMRVYSDENNYRYR